MVQTARGNHLFCLLKPINNNDEARITIDVVNLNSRRLLKIRTQLLTRIQNLTEDIADKVNEYHEADTVRKRANRKLDIEELVIELEEFKHPKQSQSFFCNQVIVDDEDYIAAKVLLAAS